MLYVAASLTPDPSGMGTHKQLGLSGCVVLGRLGFPCPMCGMTTTFSLMAHFQFLKAFKNQPFGVVLFFVVFICCVVSFLELVSPKNRLSKLVDCALKRELLVAGLGLALMVMGWCWRIYQHWY